MCSTFFPLSGTCNTDQFTCFNSDSTYQCIHHDQRCDGTANCKQGEDEEVCCGESLFGCYVDVSDRPDSFGRGTGNLLIYQCLEPLSRCDGMSDCKDESDEMNCKLNYHIY